MKGTGEANVISNFSRVVLAISFSVLRASVGGEGGAHWLIGSVAFINIALIALIILPAWKGEAIRKMAFAFVS
jgi:hypothetical protein